MGLLHSLASLLLASSTALAVTTSPTATKPCLSQPEAANIALRWFSIFQTDGNGTGTGAALVNSTLSPEFQYTDYGATMGEQTPLYTNRSAVYESVSGSGYSGALVTDVKYTTPFIWTNCYIVGARWQTNSLSANATNVTVAVGTPITYFGTDYLEVDLATRLIFNATSSSDLLNYYKQLGYNVLA
ncbi:uncharacterized protein MYCGRDRAFT_92094 [Zymoseptoria tritici IPO323]|uniref:NTF2-like domain-containing protein n=1 Tax=Zymoseptoria tritici (strain CBS 115943 / IPO323) TaxID=336722 RepID=F9X6I8_ZYMTI|nr:uncharacterized protein MYCGRDRAFT_92094 [Zymoseptoria tritici IPO323]EGP89188.1 hypothetical protein MYCGRDRAFT_92094 [Zymoseptoria tritici IPO323]